MFIFFSFYQTGGPLGGRGGGGRGRGAGRRGRGRGGNISRPGNSSRPSPFSNSDHLSCPINALLQSFLATEETETAITNMMQVRLHNGTSCVTLDHLSGILELHKTNSTINSTISTIIAAQILLEGKPTHHS